MSENQGNFFKLTLYIATFVFPHARTAADGCTISQLTNKRTDVYIQLMRCADSIVGDRHYTLEMGRYIEI